MKFSLKTGELNTMFYYFLNGICGYIFFFALIVIGSWAASGFIHSNEAYESFTLGIIYFALPGGIIFAVLSLLLAIALKRSFGRKLLLIAGFLLGTTSAGLSVLSMLIPSVKLFFLF